MKVLITSWGSFGDVYPYVGLALALKARGHEPQLAMPEFYRGFVEALGFEFHAAGPAIDPGDRDLVARLIDPAGAPKALLADLVVPAVRHDYAVLEAAAARGVDLLVTHPLTFAAPIVAEVRAIPWVSTVLAPMSFFSAADPPVLAPAPALIRLQRLGAWYGRLVARFARSYTRPWMEPVAALRRDLGLGVGAHPLFEGQFSPYLTLALFSRVLGSPQPDWPPHTDVTGFVFYNGPGALARELEAFLASGPPPVVFTLGTSAVHAAGSFYEESVAAARAAGMRAVLLTGGVEHNRPRLALPDSVLLIDRAPHESLFPRASIIVHHGGAGTTGQALRSGRPMLVVPFAHDQPDNAFRVEQLGVSRTVAASRYRAARVARELAMLMDDDRYAARALAVAAVVRDEGGADAAVEAIEARFRANLWPGNANGSSVPISQGGLRLASSWKEKLDE